MISSFPIAEHLRHDANNSKRQRKDTLNTQTKCRKCGYNHIKDNCHEYVGDFYNCGRKGYFTGLCRRPSRYPPKINNTLNAKEVDLGKDYTADPVTTATLGTGQAAEGTAAVVAGTVSVTDQYLGPTTDSSPGTTTDHPVEATDAVQPLTTTYTTTKAA